ncbi:MAG: DUF3798 domain-containing protein, partial [Treponema sp.]|nr:DUF3798 domain-containing protein [Treponema sp.]
MKKTVFFAALSVVLLSAVLLVSCGGGKTAAADTSAPYHIGICTGTVSQSEDDLRGAEELIARYGKVSDGGVIQHITYPDNFMDQQEVTITQIVALADDPKMKAIIVNQAIPGTAEAFKRVKEKRPDIILLAGEPHEDPLVIQGSADLAISAD